MSAPASSRNSPKPAASIDIDHRKRRRNRTTQSCLNCHTTKRMCDRKRPCSRCSQLGISGNCVYEVDDPSRQIRGDKGARLMKRIEELEGVIRELKNKPDTPQGQSPQSSGGTPPYRRSSSDSSPHSGASSSPRNRLGWPSTPPPTHSHSGSVTPYPPSINGPFQPTPVYPRPNASVASLVAAYAGLTDHMFIRQGSNCGCLNESECYNAVLELSLRLRRAANVLARSPTHSINVDCTLSTQVSDLDAFAQDSLLDVPSHDWTSSHVRGFGAGRASSPTSPSMFNQTYAESSGSAWNMGDSDNFMSWIPGRM
ncbi:hypothetical protein DFH07DRAFT_812398 [Mycena maculata]|uniref:Zn(2)-C6 fungal-type domain-containing protein n=1 Tax=Mycena maculata TaxID=230809 RepID=A0AAD7JHI8_9AGAR|nr:hypothetical protein DFH07DRAFT_812398 [Mycena maculata]